MKKLYIGIMAAFVLIFCVTPANAFTAYFTVDHPQLNTLDGFQFDVVGADIGDLTLIIYFQSDTTLPGAVPEELAAGFPWSFENTAANGVFGFDNSFGASPLKPGVVLSLSDTVEFELDNFIFSDNEGPNGQFPFPYSLTESDITDGKVYNFTAVPIPSTLILLGGGLIGLITVRRRYS